MLHERLIEHRQNVKAIRARTNRRIERQFAPLKRELQFLLRSDEQRLTAARMVYPHNSSYDLDSHEPPIGWMLTELLQHRIGLIRHALKGNVVPQTCSPNRRQHFMGARNFMELCGSTEMSDSDILQLITSCASEYLTAFQLTDVTFTAKGSMMFDDIIYMDVSAPTFPT